MTITLQQCLNHPGREAVALCPGCKQPYCRECVTEHDDRVLCASCLAKLTRPKEKGAGRWKAVLRVFPALGGIMFAWMLFYLAGNFLASLPSEFHDGSLWEKTLLEEMK